MSFNQLLTSATNYNNDPLLTFRQVEDLSKLLNHIKEEEEIRDVCYNLISQIRDFGYDKIYEYLLTSKNLSANDIILESPAMESSRNKFIRDNEIFKEKPEDIKGIFDKCKNCGSDNISYTAMQLRSGDEGMSAVFFCNKCGSKWVHK